MIDIEYFAYDNMRTAVKAFDPNVETSSSYIETPSKLPHISAEETDNAMLSNTISTSDREYAANVTFTVNIFTNTATAKDDAKALAAVVSDAFTNIGFVRTMKQEMPNIDRTIYRLILRFQATVWKSADGIDGHYNITAR